MWAQLLLLRLAVMAEAVAEYMVIVPNLHFALHFNFCWVLYISVWTCTVLHWQTCRQQTTGAQKNTNADTEKDALSKAQLWLYSQKNCCFLIYLFYSYYYFLKINGYMTHTKAEPMRFYNSPLFPPLGCFPWLSEKWWHLSHMLYLFRGCILSESELVFILKK